LLVRAPNWLGDVVMATPGFRALREGFPAARIALHLRSELIPLLRGAPWFDELLPLRSRGRSGPSLIAEGLRLRPRRFELGICLPDSFSAALLMRAAGVERVVGYGHGGRRLLLHQAVPGVAGAGGRWLIARERHVLGLVEAVGVSARGTYLELFVSPQDEAQAEAALAARGIDTDAKVALLAPGASFGPSKHWPPGYFARVGDALAACGAGVALIGSAAERLLVKDVADRMRARPVELAGELELGPLKAVIRRASVLVCNDAGARHVAVAFGVPTVVLLGPTSLAKTNLNLERVHVLATDVGCRPCYHRTCPVDHRCMTRLDPERVIDAALRAVGDGRGDGTLRPVSPGHRGSIVESSGP
jgi:heptosyltransferase-2